MAAPAPARAANLARPAVHAPPTVQVALALMLQVRVFGPRAEPTRSLGHEVSCTSPQMAAYCTVR